ncbi:DEAD/DEAH box helicase family protein [uncultured Kordia sp.]|uniref:DEAD/DEAH box helicase family protein n=1 Tax=uncultured Kordia sp. TaxID=507699 RepID=UPI002626F611|nr:DEAD/DEAH box helicase family protein [uncultured Kordia sp.]
MNNKPKVISNTPFESLRFQFSWRNYQEQFLAHFNLHLNDNHLHVVAPPGSGKTILGIEMLRRVQKKTIVFAPTLTIRNQWKNRLLSFFTKDGLFTDYSFDIKQPAMLTFVTYQALHTFYKSFDTKVAFLAYFESYGIEAIVLDEAHHLKNEWWKCLFALKDDRNLTTIALTATPPIDSTDQELSRYFELCGPIDEEIAVPDLVKEGDLCPHQDFIHFSFPNTSQTITIINGRKKAKEFIADLQQNEAFIRLLTSHRFLKITDEVLNEIYKEPSYFSSILIFLKSIGKEINPFLLEVLGFEKNKKVNLPEIDHNWIEILLQNLVFRDREQLFMHEEFLQKFENQMRRKGVLNKKRVDIFRDVEIFRALANSPSKLRSIVDILYNEHQNLDTQLRAVVLTDYIRKEFLTYQDITDVNLLGVLPIFQHVRTSLSDISTLAVLSGTMVIIPKSCLEVLAEINPEKEYKYSLLDCDDRFINIKINTKVKSDLVADITKLFEFGYITILVGTKSLLGEGWDSPAINTLILASFVGSYVSSNQMRGRAIRSQHGNSEKVSTIWHLACIDPTVKNGGSDFEKLERRFHAFVGISNTEPAYISTGIGRLMFPSAFDAKHVANLNERTFALAKNRKKIRNAWQTAIKKGNTLITEIQYFNENRSSGVQRKEVYHRDLAKYISAELSIGVAIVLIQFYFYEAFMNMQVGVLYGIYGLLSVLGIFLAFKIFTRIRVYVQSRFVHRNMIDIGETVLQTLHKLGYITTNLDEIDIRSEHLYGGDTVCNIYGATRVESALFVKAMQEILDPIENPRYLLEKTSIFGSKSDWQNYFTVPSICSTNKKDALVFFEYWNLYVGDAKLHFTRTVIGRKLLIKARLFHVTNVLKQTTKKEVIWK